MRVQRRRRHLGRLQRGEELGLGHGRAPLLHEVVEDVAVLPPQVVVGEAGIVEELLPTDHATPTLEHRLARHLHQHPAVLDPVEVARRHRRAPVAHAGLVDPEDLALDQHGVRHHQRGRQQRGLDVLALAGGLPVVERHHHADGHRHRRAEVDVGHRGADRLVGQALAVHRPGHHLPGAVEADPVAVGPALAVGRGAGEDDVGLDRGEALVVEPAGPHAGGRHVGHDDVGVGQEPAGDLRPFRRGGVEGEGALVAVALEEGPALAALGHGLHPAVLAALALLDPDHVRAHVGQDGAAPGRGDEAAVVEHPHPLENLLHTHPSRRLRVAMSRRAAGAPGGPPGLSAWASRGSARPPGSVGSGRCRPRSCTAATTGTPGPPRHRRSRRCAPHPSPTGRAPAPPAR